MQTCGLLRTWRKKILHYHFLKVLGQLSPEVNKRDGKYIEGGRTWYDSQLLSQMKCYDGAKGIDVLPAFYDKKTMLNGQDRGESKGAPVAIHECMKATSCK